MKRSFRIGDRTLPAEAGRLEGDRYRVVLGETERVCSARQLADGRVRIESEAGDADLVLTRGDRQIFVSSPDADLVVRIESVQRRAGMHDGHGAGEVSLPMPGRVVKVHVQNGDPVTKGQPLLVVEAMKMEHTMKAARDGVVAQLSAREGEMVEAGVLLLEIQDTTSN